MSALKTPVRARRAHWSAVFALCTLGVAGCTLAGSDANTCTIDGSYLVCSDHPDAATLVGAADSAPPVTVTLEPPGTNCPTGGQKITTSEKLPDGALNVTTTYLCDDRQVLPAKCVRGTDPFSGTVWVVCGTVSSEAGVQPLLSTVATADDSDAGEVTTMIHVDYVCQQLGYSGADVVNWNCDNTCNSTFNGSNASSCAVGSSTCSGHPTPVMPMYNYYGTNTPVDDSGSNTDLPADEHGRYADDGSGDYGAIWTCK